METVINVFSYFLWIFGFVTIYSISLQLVGFLVPSRKFKKAKKQYNYAIIICARNEESVIGQLIESLKAQDYPKEKISVFLVAHNCDDGTAQIAREHGVTVFEYNNPKERRKGYALRHGFEQIKNLYEEGVYHFDGYFFFDADNLASNSFVTEMNKAFNDKHFDFYTSYINAKNPSQSVCSSLRSIQNFSAMSTSMRPRSWLGLSINLTGTGTLIRNYMFHDGWQWTDLAEDTQMTFNAVARGYRGTYVNAANFYNENPEGLKILLRQEMRWVRGWATSFFKTFHFLLLGLLIWPRDWRGKREKLNRVERPQTNFLNKILIHIQQRLSCYDFIARATPLFVFSFLLWVIYPIYLIIHSLIIGDFNSALPGFVAIATSYAFSYFDGFVRHLIAILREHRKMRVRPKFFLYLFFWPLFPMFIQFVAFVAIFWPVKWKPIKRYNQSRIEDIYKCPTLAERIYERKNKDIINVEEK